jgi:hypothetical protein
MSTNLDLARDKLAKPPAGVSPYPFEDLPTFWNATLWDTIEATYRLSLAELGALQTARCGQSQAGKFPIMYDVLRKNVFSRTIRSVSVKHSLMNFVLDVTKGEVDKGIRMYPLMKATQMGITGFVYCDYHDHVVVRYDGNRAQISQFSKSLDDLVSKGVCDDIIHLIPETTLERREFGDFRIKSNAHGRCANNPKSEGEQWERKSSSVGSEGRDLMRYG